MTENAPAAVNAQTLEQLGVSKDLGENAKLMWILAGVFSIWGPIIFGYIVKKEGQQESKWYQDQIKKCWILAIISFIGSWCFIGWLFAIYLGFLGFKALGEGKDPVVMIVSPKGYQPAAA